MWAHHDEPVRASVIVGSVSGGEPIHVLLDALARQRGDVAFEVVVADRREDGTAERIEREHPATRVVRAPRRTTLPALRTLALDHARGEYVLVTEDHTVPPPHWVQSFVSTLDSLPERIVAVGGLVDNGLRDRTIDWATFLCEYSGYLPPQAGGEVDDVPGMNVAYRRAALAGADRAALASGFWEGAVHADLRARGHGFVRLPEVVIDHRKHIGFGAFVAQRFHYSRYFAGTRFEKGDVRKRLLYAALSPALVPLLLGRVARGTLGHAAYRRHALRSAPALAAFAVAYGVGEALGYAFGPGNSLEVIE